MENKFRIKGPIVNSLYESSSRKLESIMITLELHGFIWNHNNPVTEFYNELFRFYGISGVYYIESAKLYHYVQSLGTARKLDGLAPNYHFATVSHIKGLPQTDQFFIASYEDNNDQMHTVYGSKSNLEFLVKLFGKTYIELETPDELNQLDATAQRVIQNVKTLVSYIPKIVFESPVGPAVIDYLYHDDWISINNVDSEALIRAEKFIGGGLIRELINMIRTDSRERVPLRVLESESRKLQTPEGWYPEFPSEEKVKEFVKEFNALDLPFKLNYDMDEEDFQFIRDSSTERDRLSTLLNSLTSNRERLVDPSPIERSFYTIRIAESKANLEKLENRLSKLECKYGSKRIKSIINKEVKHAES